MRYAMLLKVSLDKQRRLQWYVHQQRYTQNKKALAEEEKKAVKAHKKEAVATVKKLILEFNRTKGDIRGKAMKQLDS